MARIRAVLRRTEDNPEQADFVYGNLMIQESRNLVSLDGKPINLTKKEMELLVLLASHPGRCIPARFFSIWFGDTVGKAMTGRWIPA